MENKFSQGLNLDPKPSYQTVVENTANLAKRNKSDKKKYQNTLNENELHPDNIEFLQQFHAFQEKVLNQDSILQKIDKIVIHVGRENIILDPLFEILQILTSCQEKLNCEACRVGAYTKRITIPEVRPDMGTSEVMQHIMSCFVIIKNQFEALLKFVRKFINNKYFIASYINMNRLIKSEIDINDSLKASGKILKVINFLRFQNAAITVHAGLKWLRKARSNIHYKHKSMHIQNEFNNNLWNNSSNDPSFDIRD